MPNPIWILTSLLMGAATAVFVNERRASGAFWRF